MEHKTRTEHYFTDGGGNKVGKYKKFYQMFPDRVFLECEFVNGLMNGKYIEYFSDGTVAACGQYVNGKRHGEYTVYFAVGGTYRKENYRNNLLHGEYTVYNSVGSVAHSEFFYEGKNMNVDANTLS